MSRADLDERFRFANSRLASLSLEQCREVELNQVRALRFAGPRPQMVRTLVKRMRQEPPSEAWRERCHHTLRRMYVRLLKEGAGSDLVQTALNAYLDCQHELAAKWLDLNTLVRPWGER